MNATRFRALLPVAAVIFFMLSHSRLAVADDASSVLASDESFFQFACTLDQLVFQDKEAEIAPMIRKTIPQGPVQSAFLARLEIILLDQKLHQAVTKKRVRYEVGPEAAEQLLKSLKVRESLQGPLQTLKDLHAQHPENQQICYLVASGVLRHMAVTGREMMRMANVMDSGRTDELISLFSDQLRLKDSVVLTQTVVRHMESSAPRTSATKICTGLLVNLMNPADGAELVLQGLHGSPKFPFALSHLLENLDINGIGQKEQDFPMLVAILDAQGTAAQAIVKSAEAKFTDDLETALKGYRYLAALGSPSPVFEDGVNRARAMIECCKLLLATIQRKESQQQHSEPATKNGK